MGRRKWTDEEIIEMKRLYEQGYNYSEIGRKIGRSDSNVRIKLKLLGYKLRGRKGSEYLYDVGEIVNDNLKIVEQIRVKDGKYTKKGYLVQSVVYPNAETYEIRERELTRGTGCSYVAGRRVCPENSLWSIESIRPYVNKLDALKVTKGSRKKIKVKCEDCGIKKIMKPDTLTRYNFSCLCNTSISYGNLAFSCYTKILELNYESEQTIDGLEGRRVDFLNNNTHMIVEVQGLQHFEKQTSDAWKDAYENTVKSDRAKRDFANNPNNPYSLIELDMRVSSWEQFKQSIENEPLLPDMSEDDEIAILELIEKNKRYPVKEIKHMYIEKKMTTYQISDKLNLSVGVVNSILKRNNIELRGFGVHSRKMVKLIETNQVFESCREAERKTGVNNSTISQCANGKLKHAGKHSVTNDKLHWGYVSESEQYAINQAKERANNTTESINLDDDVMSMFDNKIKKKKEEIICHEHQKAHMTN